MWWILVCLLVAGVAATAVAAALRFYRQKATASAKAATSSEPAPDASLLDASNSVSVTDLQHLVRHLTPSSTYWDILMAIVSAPENIAWSERHVASVAAARETRRQQIRAAILESSTSASTTIQTTDCFDDLVNADGWDEDNDDTERERKAAAAEKEKKDRYEAIRQQHKEATILCEGLDDGVLGQAWVERTLTHAGVWPPSDVGIAVTAASQSNGAEFRLEHHEGIRRMLCMTVGRLNSMMLNSHVELLQAGSQQKTDSTYFQASMEFRNRVGMYLEACLRIAMSLRSQRLLSTVVETVTMFKLGVKCGASDQPRAIPWFNTLMTRQYAILPRLKIVSRVVQAATTTPPEETDWSLHANNSTSPPPPATLEAGTASEILLLVQRIHAPQFVAVKTEQFQRQGIPPAVGLSTYREGWWFLLRVECKLQELGDDITAPPAPVVEADALPWPMEAADMEAFTNEDPSHRLITAWPMMIQNIAQEKALLKVQFTTPLQPGSYRYFVSIKSQDFFGADQELEFPVIVVEASQPSSTDAESSTALEGDDADAKKTQ